MLFIKEAEERQRLLTEELIKTYDSQGEVIKEVVETYKYNSQGQIAERVVKTYGLQVK